MSLEEGQEPTCKSCVKCWLTSCCEWVGMTPPRFPFLRVTSVHMDGGGDWLMQETWMEGNAAWRQCERPGGLNKGGGPGSGGEEALWKTELAGHAH